MNGTEELRQLREALCKQVLATAYWRDHYIAAREREEALALENIRLMDKPNSLVDTIE